MSTTQTGNPAPGTPRPSTPPSGPPRPPTKLAELFLVGMVDAFRLIPRGARR